MTNIFSSSALSTGSDDDGVEDFLKKQAEDERMKRSREKLLQALGNQSGAAGAIGQLLNAYAQVNPGVFGGG